MCQRMSRLTVYELISRAFGPLDDLLKIFNQDHSLFHQFTDSVRDAQVDTLALLAFHDFLAP